MEVVAADMEAGVEATRAVAAGTRAEAELAVFRAGDFAEAAVGSVAADRAADSAEMSVFAGGSEAGSAAITATAGLTTAATTIRSGGIPATLTPITTAILRMITATLDMPTLLRRPSLP